jgi:hypothetical protein
VLNTTLVCLPSWRPRPPGGNSNRRATWQQFGNLLAKGLILRDLRASGGFRSRSLPIY